jgi:eukaryotic-like serine/threonine-protein kinase
MTTPSEPGRWADAMTAFSTWVDLPDGEQQAWLAKLAGSDRALHELVAALIRADRDADAQSFLSPCVDAPPAAVGLEGRRLGPWLVERLIGSGGMGQVWLARRTDGLYDGRAAIKVMRLTLADAGANARFAREGRLLGRLSHPNIARLLDAGVTPSGERYLVLEHVAGERIDRWCDEHRLPVAARLALFASVCQAVAHAHENLVVHRDLKPSNILVSAGGEVKLLDFGVAKLLDDDAGEATELTREAGAALTPQYAAPEQLNGGAISTATDVYSLGMVLYGLVSGTWPFGAAPGASSSSLSGAEPGAVSRPLWSLPADPAAAERVAALRATSVAALRKALHGDLAVVAAKAIKLDPSERYRAVPDFADDLQRTREHRPISARPDSKTYRLHRYARRHAFGLGATALVVLAVLGGLAGTLVKQREAEREAARAGAVEQFLLSLFEQANGAVRAEGVQAREATISDVLAAGAKQIDHSFAAQPAIRDEVYRVLVELYADTGEPQQILSLARKRVAAAHDGFGDDDAGVASGEVQLATVLINYGENKEAAKLLAHVEKLLDRAGDRSSLERARMLFVQGMLARATDARPPWPSHPLRRAVDLLRERYSDKEEILPALVELASAACSYGKPEEARSLAEEMLRRTVALKGDDNLFADEARWLLGGLTLKAGNAVDAVAQFERAVAGFTKHVGEKNPNVVVARFGLAQAYLASGRADDSHRAIEAAREQVRRDHAGDKRLERLLANADQQLAKIAKGEPTRCGT